MKGSVSIEKSPAEPAGHVATSTRRMNFNAALDSGRSVTPNRLDIMLNQTSQVEFATARNQRNNPMMAHT